MNLSPFGPWLHRCLWSHIHWPEGALRGFMVSSNIYFSLLLKTILVTYFFLIFIHPSYAVPSIYRVNRSLERSSKNPLIAQFSTGNSSITLQHLVYHPARRVLYVGGINRLYELNEKELRIRAEIETGPRFNSPKCHASGCTGELRDHLVLTDNVNKVLVLDSGSSMLIMCGSVSQGACEKFRIANLSLTPEFISKSVAANDDHSSTFAFVGPERYNPWGGSEVLYVGTTFTTRGDYRHDVPAISTRNLYDLSYAENTFSKTSVLRIDVKYRDHFLVKYIYGFNASEYAYFVTVQKKSHLPGQEEAGYISRLARSCITDANYDSYTEISLECSSSSGLKYNLVQDSKVVPAGANLAYSLGISPGSLILIGAFSPSDGHSADPQRRSALCVYPLKEIEAKFNENIHMCFNGSMHYRNMEYISGTIMDGKCPSPGTTGNILDFCQVGLKISGVSPLYSQPMLELSRVSVTAVQSTITGNHTVAFLGTRDGTLKKVLLSGVGRAEEYSEAIIEAGSSILPDLFVDNLGHHLFILTKNTVTKYRVESCSSHSNCSSCLESRDPYCGWCSLEKKCTVQGECQKATFSSPRWLSFGAGQRCIDFEMIRPDRLPIRALATVELTIRTLPELPSGAKYLCVWGSTLPLEAEVTATGLRCGTVAAPFRPPIPQGQDHVLVPLAVRSSETNKDFVSRNFAFFDCGRHSTCGTCVKSSWTCHWCVYENTCTHNASQCDGTVVFGDQASLVQRLKKNMKLLSDGSAFCPRFWRSSPDLLAADGAPTKLNLITENLPIPRRGQLGFQCIISIEGATMKIGAHVVGEPQPTDLWGIYTSKGNISSAIHDRGSGRLGHLRKVVCDGTAFRYEAETGEYEATVMLVWNRDHIVDTRSLVLYKCGVLGAHRGHQDCSLCVTRPGRYRCAWCGTACKYAPHCPSIGARPLMHPPQTPIGLDNTAVSQCPTPRIDVIQPLAGPLEGGTVVTIEGSNLGLREGDVRGRVFIGDVPCRLRHYRVSVRIVCITGSAPRTLWGEAPDRLQFPVRVTTPAGTTQSTVLFSYTNVSISGVWPPLGPISGGTILSISGRFLNVGSRVSASLDELPCHVNMTQSSSHRLVCMTSRGFPLGEVNDWRLPRKIRSLVVTVDGARRSLPRPFAYTADPTILELKPLRSPWGGGRIITVHGTHLDSVQLPKMAVLLRGQILNSSTCRVLGGARMDCPSPSLRPRIMQAILDAYEDDARRRKRLAAPDPVEPEEVILDIGFLMDGVREVRRLQQHFPGVRSRVAYVENPTFQYFIGGLKTLSGDTLVIEGERINWAADRSDFAITIGSELCNVTSLASTQVVCIPPLSQPSSTDERGVPTKEGFPLVVVRLGRNLRYPLGLLRYETHRKLPLSPEGIAGLAAGALFVALGGFIVLALYRRKTSQAERVYKLMQLQMDSLESHVRTECKQAFAELQTDMTDLAADLETSGIPILDRRAYIMKVFFPGVSDHPILNDHKGNEAPRTNYNVAMYQFEQLLANKNFLLVFVDTLEAQKSFSIRDKVNVASLLSVLLLDRMEYLAQILRLLLLRLVANASSTKHPQLMLRRTESVVEKMLSNWLALCMYGYLKGEPGTSLFLLFKAIKHQVEKGPVDAITYEARYTLSEERLLREPVDAHSVIVHLLHDEPHYEKIPYQATTYSVCNTHPPVPPPPLPLNLSHIHHPSYFTHANLSLYAEEYEEKLQVKVLDCDTISQVKGKILNALYRNTPHSLRPSVHQVDLEMRHGRAGRISLSDEDATSVTGPGGWRRLNTLAHYGVRGSAVMALVPKQNDSFSSNCTGYYSYVNSISPLHSPVEEVGSAKSGSRGGVRYFHLVRPAEDSSLATLTKDRTYGTLVVGNGTSTHKAVPEIFLTRLLSTKGTVQQFVDDFIRAVLSANESPPGLPAPPVAVKWLFDLLDEAATTHGVSDPEVVHAWKGNCLPLRLWVTFVKNPEFAFDISKTPAVDACLGVVAQTLVDACATAEHRLGKDSPSNKLLFAKDIPKYRTQVTNFYSDVSRAQPVSEQELAQHMHQLSTFYKDQFDNLAALKELYIYITRYSDVLIDALEADTACRDLNLAHRLQSIGYILESYGNTGPVAPMMPLQLASQLSEL